MPPKRKSVNIKLKDLMERQSKNPNSDDEDNIDYIVGLPKEEKIKPEEKYMNENDKLTELAKSIELLRADFKNIHESNEKRRSENSKKRELARLAKEQKQQELLGKQQDFILDSLKIKESSMKNQFNENIRKTRMTSLGM